MVTPNLRLVYPHQLFEAHFDAPAGTSFVLVEDDLMMRQYCFHAHKLVLHRASMSRFARRLRGRGFEVTVIDSSSEHSTDERLTQVVRDQEPSAVQVYDVVDDWLSGRITEALRAGGYRLQQQDVLESPGFLTDRAEFTSWFAEHPARMQHFYMWQRRRLDVLLDGDQPVGGRWSFDTENRKKLPRGHVPPPVRFATDHGADVASAVRQIGAEFPDAPGDPTTFAWPTDHTEAQAHLTQFLEERFAEFGPYEDAISATHDSINHSLLTPMLNTGLLTPQEVLDAALDAADDHGVPIASLEGFVRQIIGWREYMRATYHLYGRRMRSANHLGHTRSLDDGWWTGDTGLDPVDLVIGRVLSNGYAHHIERLMVLGNAMSLLRIDPTEVYEWFMSLFVDAYDWVMVPNVYAMSQFAVGEAMTTKPYVSGSNYLRKMSDLPAGEWTDDWDGLFWTFVNDHREVFEGNHRSRRMTGLWDGFADDRRQQHLDRAARWLG
ncbi:cryptochrome/photolyase family protein [Yimella sp. cx-51]|uniref:cryptochrome/photolyase family protein n=1 Tax=Yimella sp. cx-51 TaxID=2770551 RepID=UPI00165D535F|nr:cryptochrome/photolyase family protein [Yimella sp. cx-51]MBC9957311.1 cryptochrome/photolyase family protein [Yimella sp. cx-51]QTH36823.1 cryptochrome/photolyase family protein [Yimella sp. cx-51]